MNPTTIVTAYEVLEMSITEIAEDQCLEESAVKIALLQNSAKYRSDAKKGKVEDVTEEEFTQIKEAYKALALYGETEYVRERALRRLWDEKKGRLDNNDTKGLKVNVLVVNRMIAKSREAKAAIEEKVPIDV